MITDRSISPEIREFCMALLPAPGTMTEEEFLNKCAYEDGRNEAIADTANLEMLHKMLEHLRGVSGAFADGYREYANAWLVINRA